MVRGVRGGGGQVGVGVRQMMERPHIPLPPPPTPGQVLAPCAARINVNDQIMELYLDHLLPEITQPGDDANYGSSAMHDVTALQASARA